MKYLYRCDCGFEQVRDLPMTEPVSARWAWGDHESGGIHDPNALPCQGDLKRVFEAPMTNLGYRPLVHTPNERHLFESVG